MIVAWYAKVTAYGRPVVTRGPYHSRRYAEEKAKEAAADLRDEHPDVVYDHDVIETGDEEK